MPQCSSITKSGVRCKNNTVNVKCYIHGGGVTNTKQTVEVNVNINMNTNTQLVQQPVQQQVQQPVQPKRAVVQSNITQQKKYTVQPKSVVYAVQPKSVVYAIQPNTEPKPNTKNERMRVVKREDSAGNSYYVEVGVIDGRYRVRAYHPPT